MLRQVMEVRVATLGPDHPETLDSFWYLVGLLLSQGSMAKAAELCQGSVRWHDFRNGSKYTLTLKGIAGLVESLATEGKPMQAEALQCRVAQLQLASLGPEHPDTLASLASLEALLPSHGRLKEAEALQSWLTSFR